MELTIIVVSWNTASVTISCLRSLIKFLSNFDFHITVVDNASTDDTVKKVKHFFHSVDFKNFDLIVNRSNLGYAKACNLGAKKAPGHYLLFLNSDIEIIDDRIIQMLGFIKKNPNIGIIGPRFLNPDTTRQASVFPPQTPLNAFKHYFLSLESYPKYSPKTKQPISVWAISGGAILINKDFFNLIRGWNEKYFMYYEDLDLCRTVRKFNKEIVYYPHCQVIHRHGASGRQLVSEAQQWHRLVPGSIKYHGLVNHYLINSIIWAGQKFQKLKLVLFKK